MLAGRRLASGIGQADPLSDDRDENVNEIDNYWEARRLDGSRDYGQIREDAQFGSHPSYDGCDVESSPYIDSVMPSFGEIISVVFCT